MRKVDFGHLYEHSPRGIIDDKLLEHDNQEEDEFQRLMMKKTLRELRFGKNISFKGLKQYYMDDKLYNADAHLKSHRDVENDQIVPKVMRLLSPVRKAQGKADPSSDEDRDPVRAKEKRIKFQKNMVMVDLEINQMKVPAR